MNFKNASRVVGALASVLLLSGVASAAQLGAGQFNVASSVYLTNSGFFIGTDADTAGMAANQTASIFKPTTGPFSGLAATAPLTMKNLTAGLLPPGQPGLISQFVQLPNGIDLDATLLEVSTFPVCSAATPNGPCQAQAGSPITLISSALGIPPGVSAVFNISGVAYEASDPSTATPFQGIFTAQFIAPPDNDNRWSPG